MKRIKLGFYRDEAIELILVRNYFDYVPNDINANDINANDINANNIKINQFPENIKQLNASDWLKIEIQPCVIFSLALNHCYSQYVGT